MSFKLFTLAGRLVQDPKLKPTENSQVCEFSLALDDFVKGEKTTEFYNVKAWAHLAEFSFKYFKKGKKVLVSGVPYYESYTAKDGTLKKILVIKAEHLEFADGKD